MDLFKLASVFFFSFLDLYPGVELPGHIVVLFLVIIFFGGGGSFLFSTVAAPIYSQRVSEGSLPPHPSHICYLHSFDGKHFDRSDVISHLNFPDD